MKDANKIKKMQLAASEDFDQNKLEISSASREHFLRRSYFIDPPERYAGDWQSLILISS